jgi:cupin 2 domain-containing protein
LRGIIRALSRLLSTAFVEKTGADLQWRPVAKASRIRTMPEFPPLASLLADLPDTLPEERFETLLETPAFRLERILSLGHATPEGEWYDQERDEWVMLLQGEARLAVEGRSEAMVLKPGDAVLLPAHCRHRVEWTPSDRVTVWLALHFSGYDCFPNITRPPAP